MSDLSQTWNVCALVWCGAQNHPEHAKGRLFNANTDCNIFLDAVRHAVKQVQTHTHILTLRWFRPRVAFRHSALAHTALAHTALALAYACGDAVRGCVHVTRVLRSMRGVRIPP